MKKELIDIINRLKNSPSILISVINKETGQPLVRSFSADRFVEKYGSVEAFFNSLVSEGISQIIVEERRKLGNTTRSFSTPKTFILGPKEEDTPPQATPEVMPATVAPAPLQQPMGQMGLMGLSFPQMMDLHVKAHDQGRLEVENKFLKEKNEKLEQEIAALKEERLADKFSEAKAKGNNEMLLGIVQNLPMLMGAFKGGRSYRSPRDRRRAAPSTRRKRGHYSGICSDLPRGRQLYAQNTTFSVRKQRVLRRSEQISK